jgi:hypothetical protein
MIGIAVLMGAMTAAVESPAQDGWNPFAKSEEPRPRERRAAPPPAEPAQPFLPPMTGVGRWLQDGTARPGPDAPPTPPTPPDSAVTRQELPPLDSRSSRVESGELAPAVASDGSGLPYELWQGLDPAAIEALMTEIEMPPRSPALGALWRRLLTADVPAPSGPGAGQFESLRLEALHRSGMIAEMADLLARARGRGANPVLAIMQLRLDLGRGRSNEVCASQREIAARRSELPPPLRAEVTLVGGYCALVAGNVAAAGLAADLAREEGAKQSFALTALDALGGGRKPGGPLPQRLSALDFRLLERGGGADLAQMLDRADPALLAMVAEDQAAAPRVRIAAAEAAARLSAITGEQLAEAWRRAPAARADSPETAGGGDAVLRRATLFRAAETERTPQRRARHIRALLDDARRAGLYVPTARALEKATADLPVTPEIGWFAETAIEVMLIAGRYDDVRRIAGVQGLDRGNEPLAHWLAMADIADPGFPGRRGESLASVEQLALRGRFGADLLHRLATVLDALDYNVPIPLWEAASRTPQPTGGHLPGTGVLTELQDAAKKKQFGRTVMLAMKTLGPGGPDTANILALGDAIRALKRAGLEADARRIGLEALFAAWPRSTSN